ncbi:ComF family protein [Portibacter marinus]|uniref:ComF family protein n=1 Tax=Portibacter marinus TaxID=2898660 RepID=UPI001F2FFA41|nr:phosphoribosyltransferase family protein [Portibacter marinus]
MIRKLGELFNAIYPELCVACDERYPVDGSCFCFHCHSELPFTNFHLEHDNVVEKYFWGRLMIEKATALFYFQKGEVVQEMMHRLKYKNEGFIGKSLGIHFAQVLNESDFMDEIDLIIPIPIHPSKRKTRNYNQSALIAEGISLITGIPFYENILVKHRKSPSQTLKSREERILNLMNTLKVNQSDLIQDRNVLIVDDILTTGATIEAACSLLSGYNCKLSVAVVAVGKY